MGEDLFHLGVKALIVDDAGKVLLLKVNPEQLTGSNRSNTNYWDLAGGRVQRGASVEKTLAREVEEELGLYDITVMRPVGMVISPIRIPLPDKTDVGLVLSIYECAIPADAELKISSEHLAYDWFEPAEAAKRLAIKYPKEFCDLIAKL